MMSHKSPEVEDNNVAVEVMGTVVVAEMPLMATTIVAVEVVAMATGEATMVVTALMQLAAVAIGIRAITREGNACTVVSLGTILLMIAQLGAKNALRVVKPDTMPNPHDAKRLSLVMARTNKQGRSM